MGATPETVAEYAAKYSLPEETVRDIAGLDAPAPIEVSVEQDEENPAKFVFTVSGYKGEVIGDFGGSGFVEAKTGRGGKFTHVFATPGQKRVRLDLGGAVRWVDVVAGVNTEEDADTPVEEVPIPLGAPDFSQTLLGVDTNAPAEGQEPSDGEDGGDAASDAAGGADGVSAPAEGTSGGEPVDGGAPVEPKA